MRPAGLLLVLGTVIKHEHNNAAVTRGALLFRAYLWGRASMRIRKILYVGPHKVISAHARVRWSAETKKIQKRKGRQRIMKATRLQRGQRFKGCDRAASS